jgi:hypothetical protein
LLILVVLGFAGVSGYSLYNYSSSSNLNNGGFTNPGNQFSLNGSTLVLFAFVLITALVLGYGYVALARMFTKQFIWISGILNICMTIATAAYQFYRGAYVGGILFALLAVFTIICFISWIKRIPFSVLMFQTAVDVSKNFGHVYLVSFMGGLIAAAFSAWFAATMVAIYVTFQPTTNNAVEGGSRSSGTVIGLMVFVTFAGYWVTEWIKNTIHVTISGVYGAWYFSPQSPAKGATRGAAKRALTYSFGSIALGSLIVAILDFLRFACSIARGQGGTGNPIADCAFCILQCLLGLIQWAIEFVNRYAFSYMVSPVFMLPSGPYTNNSSRRCTEKPTSPPRKTPGNSSKTAASTPSSTNVSSDLSFPWAACSSPSAAHWSPTSTSMCRTRRTTRVELSRVSSWHMHS